MNTGKIYKIRLGHHANCSGMEAYVFITIAAIAWFVWTGFLSIIQLIMAAVKVQSKRVRMLAWVIPMMVLGIGLILWDLWSWNSMEYFGSLPLCYSVILVPFIYAAVLGALIILHGFTKPIIITIIISALIPIIICSLLVGIFLI